MNCKNCNQDLTSFMFLKGFNYCPYCGFEINGEKKEEEKKIPSAYVVNNSSDSTLPTGNLFSFNVFDTNFELVKCFAGKFLMGSPTDEIGRFNNETLHEVIIKKDFYIGKYPVTQAQYKVLMEYNPSKFKGQNNPVDSVDWDHAKEFCYRLNEVTQNIRPAGYLFDLPTEAQWEYACRANTNTSLNNGNNISKFISESLRRGINSNLYYSYKPSCPYLDEVGWYDFNSNKETHSVGKKKPNNWGIYDMHGNVLEWCRDYYWDNYLPENADPDTTTNPNERKYTWNKVCRGGSYDDEPRYCRSAFRYYICAGARTACGFRIALICSDKLVKF